MPLHSEATDIFQETIIQTGITCKETPCYMRDSSCWWSIVKKAKIFWSYVKYFWILPEVRHCRILISLWNTFSWIVQSYFSTEIIKRSFASFFFLLFRLFLSKNKISYKIWLLTVIISLCRNETSKLNCFVYNNAVKNRWETKPREL